MTQRRRGTRLVGGLLGSLIVLAGALGIAGPAAALIPDSCYGTGTSNLASCTGKDPQEYLCATDAVTQSTTTMPTGYVQLRYSSACHARWARFTWTGAGQSAIPATIWIENTSGTRFSKAVAGYVGEQVWTRMFSGTVTTRACVNFYSSLAGWVTTCTAWKP